MIIVCKGTTFFYEIQLFPYICFIRTQKSTMFRWVNTLYSFFMAIIYF